MRISILLIVCLLTGSLKAADPVRLDDLGRLRTVSQLTLDPSGGRAVAVVDGLVARGHAVERWASHATTQLIEQDLDTSQLHAVSDRRKGGVPAGYD